jgi:hypothetical protein
VTSSWIHKQFEGRRLEKVPLLSVFSFSLGIGVSGVGGLQGRESFHKTQDELVNIGMELRLRF